MKKIYKCDAVDYPALVRVWERSVRATHDFLDEDVINEIKNSLIPVYFPNVDLYAVSDDDKIVGFVGLHDDMIEMLFVDSDSRGRGYGSALIEYAIQKGATRVDVNEQNQMAHAFYRAKGFMATGRDATDDAGRPYPILHLALVSSAT